MMIVKYKMIYTIKENLKSWTILTKYNGIDLSYNLPKADFPTAESIKNHIMESGLFMSE